MIENTFVFADLSTYDPKTAREFYAAVFGWEFQSAGDAYWLARRGTRDLCGLYETPQKFQAMNMPSFWMSYIQAGDVERVAERARTLGGIVELVEQDAYIGKIALIRDPLGAGFTVCEGDRLNSRFADEPGALVWNELFVSDFTNVRDFYEGIFDWRFDSPRSGRRLIRSGAQAEAIGAVQEVDNAIKGDQEYWSVFFGASDLAATKAKALGVGGKLIYEDADTTILADPGGAFFHLSAVRKANDR